MSTADLADPFATAGSLGPDEEDPERITGGRYRLPGLHFSGSGSIVTESGPKKGGYQRVTTLVKAIGDARALDLWHQRKLLYGLVIRPDLYDLVCATVATTPEEMLKGELEKLASRILLAAAADEGANLGTAFHGFTEAQDLGLIHYARKRWHGKLLNYQDGLAAQGLSAQPEYVERKVVILRYNLAGTLDRLLLDLVTGCLRVGDLKSQKTFWTWLEIAAQLAAYQMADAMWDRQKLAYVDMPTVADDQAVVAWMPVTHPQAYTTGVESDGDMVEFFDVDLEKGRRALDLCYQVDRIRSEAKSAGQTWGLLRPMPELSRVETYAHRLETVSDPQEGSALWAEVVAQGLDRAPELVELARVVASRFMHQA